MRQGRKGLAAIAVLLVLFIVAGIGIVIGHSDSYLPQNKVIGWALASTLFGILVGRLRRRRAKIRRRLASRLLGKKGIRFTSIL